VKLVMTLVVRDDADVLDAQLAYHLNAGVDLVIVADRSSQDGTTEILESYAREGYVQRLPGQGESREAELVNRMAQLAVSDHAAEWVIDARPDEFWWPRGESLQDVLVAIPPRYSIVQALVRTFVPRLEETSFFAERMVIRRSLLAPGAEAGEPLAGALRQVYRAGPNMLIRVGPEPVSPGRVPLRAWYPIEVFHFPARDPDQLQARAALGMDDEELEQGLAAGSLAVDERLRDALRELRIPASEATPTGRQFLLPSEGTGRLAFRTPDIVDDAAYAAECAAVGEVNLARLDLHIRDLEDRIAWLEDRLWPRVLRTLSRLVHRPGR
jgi:glycosyl transferase family 2